MNILQTETLKGWGGQQNKIILESIALGELGHKVILVCNPGARIRERAEKHGIQICLEHLNTRDDSHPMKGHPG